MEFVFSAGSYSRKISFVFRRSNLHRSLLAILVVMVFAGECARFAAAAERPAPVTVTPEWLAGRLQDPKLVVLHVASLRDDYTREHIPGARFLWPTWFAVTTPDLGYELASVDSLTAVLRRLGVSNDSEIVLYHVLGDVAGTARMYVTLDYLGMGDRTKILDGGLPAWKAAGQPVTKEKPNYTAGTFVPAVRKDVVVNLDTMRSRYHSEGTKLLDARSPQAYNADKGEGVFRGGHIPGAVNIPYTALFDSLDRYHPLDSIAVKFEKAGVKPGSDVIVYCGSGRTASPMYIAAKMLGFNVRLYDGSFQEWSRKEDLPVEQTKVKK
jgi:thiosulfate/3-mercaptopyruvate sulfurtransferase